VIFLQQSKYIIGSPLDLSNLSHVDVDIQGSITFTNDTDFWQENAFQFDFQDARSFFLLGGEDVHVYGGGALEGNGQPWWNLFYTNKTVKRPILFTTVGLHGGSVSDLSLNNSPFWTNIVANSSYVVFTDINIRAISHTFSFEKNTDGWDIIQSDHITIQNSTVTNGDGKCTCRAERAMLSIHRLRFVQAKRHEYLCSRLVL
jgi:galacturan 1,4-alpha-galacturonidase